MKSKFKQINFVRFLIHYNENHGLSLDKYNTLLGKLIEFQAEGMKFDIVRMELDILTKNQDKRIDTMIELFQKLVHQNMNKEVSILAGEFCMHYDYGTRMLYFGNILSEY